MNLLYAYHFQDRVGDCYYVDSSGAVQLTSDFLALRDDPDGWEDTLISFDRNETSQGIFRKSTVPLKFHSDAAKILRYIFYTYGVNGYLKIRIDKLNRDFDTNNWQYDLWYECEADFGQGNDGDMDLPPGDVFFTVRMLELGLPFYMEANFDTTYEIPLYPIVIDPDAIPVRMGGIKVSAQYDYIPFASFFGTTFTGIQQRELQPWFYLSGGESFELAKYQDINTSVTNVNYITGVGNTLDVTSYEYQKLINYYTGFIDVKYRSVIRVFNNNLSSTDALRFRFRVIIADTNRDITYDNVTYVSAPVAIGATDTFIIEWSDLQIPINQNDRLYVFFELFTATGISQTIQANVEILAPSATEYGTYEKYIVYSPLPNTLVYGFKYKDLIIRLLRKMTGGSTYGLVSNLLDDDFLDYFTRPNFNVVVPSSAMRGIKTAAGLSNDVIKTSMKEVMQDLLSFLGAGYSTEGNNLRIEKAAYFYQQNTQLANVTVYGTVNKTIAVNHIYGKVRVGYSNNQVDELNGLQSFCCEHVYDCGLTSSTVASKEMDLVSPYMHDPFSIETLRSWNFKSDQTSIPTDNDNCVVEINVLVDDAYELAKAGFNGTTFTTGVMYPSDIFNVGHSPKACLIRNLPFIKSFIADGEEITFTTADKNPNLGYGDATITVTDKSNLKITPNGAINTSASVTYINIFRIFLAYYFMFKGKLPENLLALMETTISGVYRKYGTITIDDNGAELNGFALDVGVNPGSEDVYQIKLLCSPTTIISNLIR